MSAWRSTSSATRSDSFAVPAAKSGNTRLRVVMSDKSGTSACGSYSYGGTEDYPLTVTGGSSFASGLASLTGCNTGSNQQLEVYPTDYLLRLGLGGDLPVQSVEVPVGPAGNTRHDGNNQLDVNVWLPACTP